MTAPAEMLDAFASVGVLQASLTVLDLHGKKRMFLSARPFNSVRRVLPWLIRDTDRQQRSIIIRPTPPSGITLVQLDDLDAQQVARIAPAAFIVLCTSPANYQAWVALSDGDSDFARRLRKGIGADLGASGAVRLAGTRNFKEKHAPVFPVVEIVASAP